MAEHIPDEFGKTCARGAKLREVEDYFQGCLPSELETDWLM